MSFLLATPNGSTRAGHRRQGMGSSREGAPIVFVEKNVSEAGSGSLGPVDFTTTRTNDGWDALEVKGVFPCPRVSPATAVVGDLLYVFGGAITNGVKPSRYLDDFHSFDWKSRSWTTIDVTGSKPGARHSATLVPYNNHLYLFGGCAEGQIPLGDCWIYSIDSNSWQRMRYEDDQQSSSVENILVSRPTMVFKDPPAFSSRQSRLAPTQRTKVSAARKSVVASTTLFAPRARYAHSAVEVDGKMLIFGGWSSDWSAQGNGVWSLDLDEHVWTELEPFKTGAVEKRYGHVATVHNNCMYIFGGCQSTRVTGELLSLDLATLKWSVVPEDPTYPGPGPRKGHAAAMIGNYWIIHGGLPANTTVENTHIAFAFNFGNRQWIPVTLFGTIQSNGRALAQHVLQPMMNKFCVSLVSLFGLVPKEGLAPTHQCLAVDLLSDSAFTNISSDAVELSSLAQMLSGTVSAVLPGPPDEAYAALDGLRQLFVDEVEPRLQRALLRIETKVESRLDGARQIRGEENGFLLKEIASLLRRLDEIQRLWAQTPPDEQGNAILEPGTPNRKLIDQFVDRLANFWDMEPEQVMDLVAASATAVNSSVSSIASVSCSSKAVELGNLLEKLHEFIKTAVEDILIPSQETLEQLPQSDVVNGCYSFYEKAAEAAHSFISSEERLVSQQTQSSQRSHKTLETRRFNAGMQLLEAFNSRAKAIAEALQQPPLPHATRQSLTEYLEGFTVSASTDAEVSAKSKKLYERLLAHIDKTGREQEATLQKSKAELEAKRSSCWQQRQELLERVNTFIKNSVDEYLQIIANEREAVLQSELQLREGTEMWRRLQNLKTLVETPLKQEQLSQQALEMVLTPTIESVGMITQSCLEKHSADAVEQLTKVATDAAADWGLFGPLYAGLRGYLERQLKLADRNVRLLQSRLRAADEDLAAAQELGDKGTAEIQQRIDQMQSAEHEAQVETAKVQESIAKLDDLRAEFVDLLSSVRESSGQALAMSESEKGKIAIDLPVAARMDASLFQIEIPQAPEDPDEDLFPPEVLSKIKAFTKTNFASPPKSGRALTRARNGAEQGQIISQTTTTNGRVRTTTTVRKEQQLLPDGRTITRTLTRRSRQII